MMLAILSVHHLTHSFRQAANALRWMHADFGPSHPVDGLESRFDAGLPWRPAPKLRSTPMGHST